jgi:hypothetical protein
MNSKFDFNQFKAHYELQDAMRDMCLVFKETVTQVSHPLFSGEGEETLAQQTARLTQPIEQFL